MGSAHASALSATVPEILSDLFLLLAHLFRCMNGRLRPASSPSGFGLDALELVIGEAAVCRPTNASRHGK